MKTFNDVTRIVGCCTILVQLSIIQQMYLSYTTVIVTNMAAVPVFYWMLDAVCNLPEIKKLLRKRN